MIHLRDVWFPFYRWNQFKVIPLAGYTSYKKPPQLFWDVRNARFHRFSVGQISRNLNTTLSLLAH